MYNKWTIVQSNIYFIWKYYFQGRIVICFNLYKEIKNAIVYTELPNAIKGVKTFINMVLKVKVLFKSRYPFCSKVFSKTVNRTVIIYYRVTSYGFLWRLNAEPSKSSRIDWKSASQILHYMSIQRPSPFNRDELSKR